MQPSSLPIGQWGCRNETQDTFPDLGQQCGEQYSFGPSSFNFNDLSMKKVPTDYFNFNLKPVRECVTTPPLPSSSPGPGNDSSMELSPLPHKAPYQSINQIRPQSPSPEATPSEDVTMACTETAPQLPVETSRPNYIERKRSSFVRPSLARARGSSTTSVSLKTIKVENSLPTFKFGNGASALSGNLRSLDECLMASPPLEKRPHTANSPLTSHMGPPKMRQPFPGIHSSSRSTASPMLGQVRKPSSNCPRPRKQFRRSLSMFEHPGDVMKQQQPQLGPAEALDIIMDTVDNPQLQLHLPHFMANEESVPRITKETMIDVLDGKYQEPYDQSLIVDCRFEYEYEGGHIDGAINVNSKEEAKFLRQRDRAFNAHRYPLLTYPEVYILDGGYSSFFQDHRYRCSPQNYVEMAAKEHASACERGLGRIKQQRGKLSRAQTFAFGQHNQPLEDSPTACGRQTNMLSLGMDISMDHTLEAKRTLSRRNASY
ncbi:MAG: hypothetical protein Q9212_003223 [Teloschistes hypoglaucus]